ncbi:hypothetical protein ABT256_27110 [Amycolatopsis japonica]|uniref:hypothetical protein n=1 Tax=Amycolatopsis japonica TaxID=208439 RepID=UPI00331E4A25
MLPSSCPARSCTRLTIVAGMVPFLMTWCRPAATSASSGTNGSGLGIRDRGPFAEVVDMIGTSSLVMSLGDEQEIPATGPV